MYRAFGAACSFARFEFHARTFRKPSMSIWFEVAWKEITAKGRIVCKRRAFKSDTARETYIDQLIQKDSFYEIVGLRDPL